MKCFLKSVYVNGAIKKEGDRTMSELRRYSEMLRNIRLAADDTEMCMNTHSQDQCNEALYDFYKRVRLILHMEKEQ